MAACDVYRPAAVDQLVKVGEQAGVDVYEQGTDRNPVEIAKWAADRARTEGKDVLIVDTSGRLHVDAELMAELADIKKAVKPHDVLLVVDAMTGQDAVNVAEQFAEVGRLRRRRHDQARRRRSRRRGALASRRSPASRSCSRPPARSSTSSSASTRTGWPSGSSAWAT